MDPSQSTSYAEITKELYGKNVDLVNANKTLELIQKLYDIMISSFTVEDISQRFIETIAKSLGFSDGIVVLASDRHKYLTVAGFTDSEVNKALLDACKLKVTDIRFDKADTKNSLVKAFETKKPVSTKSLWTVWTPYVKQEDIAGISKASNAKLTLVYPIIFGEKNLGSFALSLGKNTESLTQFESKALARLQTVFGIAIDRVRIQIELQETQKRELSKIKELDAKKDEFINMAAHELRAPLTAIKGFISMVIGGDTGEISKQASEFLNDSAVSTERMIRLVNNMLNVSRIEEGRMVFQPSVFHVGKTAESAYKEFQVEAVRKSLKFTLDVKENISDLVYVDEDKLHEVIVNFVSNAIKYTETGEVVIKIFNSQEKMVRVEVVDSGSGISEDEQKKLFQKFYRVESKVGKTIGTGLGLYISKLLVEKFGGHIGVNSEPGKGSTFWFELPVTDKSEDDKNITPVAVAAPQAPQV